MATTKNKKAHKPSKVVKPQKSKKKSTFATKNHRFRSFSERIASLKIDPVRRRRMPEDVDQLSDKTATHFGKSLEEWRDLNLSQTFTTFAKEASPLCASLPVVLHNEEKLMDLLVEYINKGDSLALEPLLVLMSRFAHDLDVRFEKHFQLAVSTVADMAAKHSDPAVVEWSFACIAWLFKYLSRLLTPDLRPLYDLMSRYLGKESQKPFIVRFAAESMSFLIRKTAAKYERDEKPLDDFINHVFRDCRKNDDATSSDLYRQGVMTLLTESIKGIQSDIHSSGLFVLRSMLKHVQRESNGSDGVAMKITKGVLTSLIHHTDAGTFRPIQDTVLQLAQSTKNTSPSNHFRIAAPLIFTIATVRKGTRITDWVAMVASVERMVDSVQEQPEMMNSDLNDILSAVAVVFQNGSLQSLLPALGIFKTLKETISESSFSQFCDLFARLGRERSEKFVLPQFRKLMVDQQDVNDEILCQLLPLLSNAEGKKLICSSNLQRAILSRLRSLTHTSGSTDIRDIASAHLALALVPRLIIEDEIRQELTLQQSSLLNQSLERKEKQCTDQDKLALGSCLACILDEKDSINLSASLWTSLCTESPRFIHLERFWTNLLQYIRVSSTSDVILSGSHVDILEASILNCVSMPSHVIRLSALEIIKRIYELRKQHVPDALCTAIDVESIPVSFETSRDISMKIRKLASAYSELDDFLQNVIPRYCFGILNFQLAQAWDDAVHVLADISKSSIGEEAIMNVTQSWLAGLLPELDNKDPETSPQILDIESKGFQVISDFECSNLAKVSAICQQVLETPRSGHPSSEALLLSENACIPTIALNARGQALRVLNKIPALAEKRSRTLVPVLLKWAGTFDTGAHDEILETTSSRWSRKDQKAMLGVFAQFTNPKVLYKSNEAYSALLNLCANGDVEIQRSALKAMLAWKDPIVNQSEEHLLNLLDEARFREELSVFIQDHDEEYEASTHPERRSKLMPILLRLLYGRAVAGGSQGQSSRRKAIFVALSCHDPEVLGMFIDIALGSTRAIDLLSGDGLDVHALEELQSPLRRQLGTLNMLNDMLETLGSKLELFSGKLVKTVLICSVSAARALEKGDNDHRLQDISLLRSVRQVGIQCLAKIFQTMPSSELSSYANIAMEELIIPRLEKLELENTESVSGVLRLLSAWASAQETHRYLVDFHPGVLSAISALLRNSNIKDGVCLFVLQDIVDRLLLDSHSARLTQSQITSLVQSLGYILSRAPTKAVLDACVVSFSLLSGHIEKGTQEAKEVVHVCATLLTKPSKIVANTTKIGLLKTVSPLVESSDTSIQSSLYGALCGLFSRLQELEERAFLSEVFVAVCTADGDLLQIAEICQDLNSIGGRLDEPDHGRREAGFAKIYESYKLFSLRQWQGVIHNCLFYIQDRDDLINRTSASRALERFIDAGSSNAEDFRPLLSGVLLPGIVYGMKSSSELVRAEYLHLLGHLVEEFPQWQLLKDMKILTANGDEEASFFKNVLHIQQHRRLRALRRLADEAINISSSNITRILIPLLEHFIFEQAEGDAGRVLGDQTISTLGALCRSLNWSAYRATFKRYTALLGSEDQEKYALRLLSGLADTLRPRPGTDSRTNEPSQTSTPSVATQQSPVSLEKSSLNDHSFDDYTLGEHVSSQDLQLSTGIADHKFPVLEKVHYDIVAREFLPSLMEYLHRKDESTVDRRMPVATSIVKILLSLPESELSARLPPVLTDVCHVLRSRSQEARDQTRKTLGDILSLIGPSYLGFILKELRGALQRGYQLHVLSFTVHHLLVNAPERYTTGELDQCLAELSSIVMDDIFGVTGQEKDSEDYKSTMKEVKSSKSFDTMELLARMSSVQNLRLLIQPILALLSQKLDSKALSKIDDLLSRFRKGIDQNPSADSRDILIFCHELVRQVYAETMDSAAKTEVPRRKANMYLVQPEPGHISKARSHTSSQAFRVVSFALNLVRKVVRRHENLMTPANLAGFLPIAGDALIEGQEEVQLSAMKLLGTIIKVQLTELDTNGPMYVKEAVRLIKTAPSMTAPSAKTGLDLITSILRERRSVQVNIKDIAEVLKILKADLDEPDRQNMTYKFLRAVLGRRIMITEVYEVMDEVVQVVVTNPDRNVRESARCAYLLFILDYPSGEERWKKSVDLLFKNLEYEHATGRQSIMELIHQLIAKLPDDKFAKLASEPKRFAAICLVAAVDQDESCRNMAAFLITMLFERIEETDMKTYLTLVDKWLSHDSGYQIVALQCWMALLRSKRPLSNNRAESVRDNIDTLLTANNPSENTSDNRVVDKALQTFDILIDVAPDVGFSKKSTRIWKSLDKFFTPSETEAISAKLLGRYFNHLASTNSKDGRTLAALPLRGADGLELSADEMCEKCSFILEVLLRPSEDGLEESFKSQAIRNLVFLGRCFAANEMKWQRGKSEKPSALAYLFNRLSYAVRQENMHVSARTTAVQCLTGLISVVGTVPNPEDIMRPLYSLTDPSIPQPSTALHDTLVENARELLDLLKKKLGSEAYIAALGSVRSAAIERREDRRVKRRIDAVNIPERALKKKR